MSVIDQRREHIGGAQAILADLAAGLGRRGHEVHLAAVEGSRVRHTRPVRLGVDARAMVPAAFGDAAPRSDADAQRDAFTHVRQWLDEHGEIEVVHAHAYDAPAFDALEGSHARVFHTLHLPPLDREVVGAARRAQSARHITVSRANATAWTRAGIRIHAIVANGIDLGRVPFGDRGGAYLVSAGRIAPEKGTHLAIAAAAAARLPLVIVGGVYDREYFEREVMPHVGGNVSYFGPWPREELYRILAKAAATLMPVRWDEPFGIVALESLAAGTPVVGFARGGLVEIVDETCGALVPPEDVGALVAAIPRAIALDRHRCRSRAERFSLDRMIDAYEEVLA